MIQITVWTQLYLCENQLHSKARSKSATNFIAEYHHGCLQSTPLGKLYTDASASSTLQNNFVTGFVEWPSELPLYYSWCHQCHQNGFLSILRLLSSAAAASTRWRVRELNGPTTYSHHQAEACSWFAHNKDVFRLRACFFSFLFVYAQLKHNTPMM